LGREESEERRVNSEERRVKRAVEVGAHDDPRKITVKAKNSIENPFSIVGTGVPDCPMSLLSPPHYRLLPKQ
jgi:hypothetical protein